MRRTVPCIRNDYLKKKKLYFETVLHKNAIGYYHKEGFSLPFEVMSTKVRTGKKHHRYNHPRLHPVISLIIIVKLIIIIVIVVGVATIYQEILYMSSSLVSILKNNNNH